MRPASDYPYFTKPFTALAHRGGSLLPGNVGRENTLVAFRAAVELGYTHVETDVHATRDGHLVAFHDDVLDRVSDRTGEVAQTDFEEVRRASIGGERVPTLDEVLEEFPDTCVNIDIKAPGAVDLLATTIRRHRAQHRVCVGSFSVSRLERFRRMVGDQVPTAVGPAGVALASQLPATMGLVRGQAFQIPVRQHAAGRDIRVLSAELLDAAHRHGKVVHVWTINDRDQMDELLDMGVDGIVTDEPLVLREVLQARGLWH